MSQTNTLPTVNHEPLRRIAERIALPLFLFAAVMFGLLLLSWALLLPRFTHIEVNGSLLSPAEVLAYEGRLAEELRELEDTRNRLVLPVQDETYRSLLDAKRRDRSVLGIIEELDRIARGVSDVADSIVIDSLSVDVSTRAVVLTGDVRNVGPRSMTLLASFVEAVEKSSIVTDLEHPAFTRTEAPGIGFHSPFSFSFSIAASADL